MTDAPGTAGTTEPTGPTDLTTSTTGLRGTGSRPQAPGTLSARRALRWALALMVLAACLPVLAQLTASPPASTLMWLASMPLCLAGAGVAGRGALRLAGARRAQEEDETRL
ncbi:hypothetical protein [Actinomyces wuliandei]|uniref:hypothetical protein n=1 Tax=Actinomyces wuliandei TaxID=2057743 RepID=UPI000FD841ED|nr:hypothetical protein [Actinomyces wuliandei]